MRTDFCFYIYILDNNLLHSFSDLTKADSEKVDRKLNKTIIKILVATDVIPQILKVQKHLLAQKASIQSN